MAEANANQGYNRQGIVTGANGFLELNGQPVAFCRGINFSYSIQYEPMDVLDNIEVEEFVPVAYRVDSLSAELIDAMGETLIGRGIQPPQDQVATVQEYTLVLKDRPRDAAFGTLEGVRFQNRSLGFRKGQVTASNIGFVAKRFRDQSGRV